MSKWIRFAVPQPDPLGCPARIRLAVPAARTRPRERIRLGVPDAIRLAVPTAIRFAVPVRIP